MRVTDNTIGYTIHFENHGKRGMIGTWEPTIMDALNTVRSMGRDNEIITLTRIAYKNRMSVERVVQPYEYKSLNLCDECEQVNQVGTYGKT